VRFDERDLVQDLSIFDVHVDGDDVHVDVYGGRKPVCGSVRFTFPDDAERTRHVTRLQQWRDKGMQVALWSAGSTLRLFREEALIRRALDTGDTRPPTA
jgi:hypothetical protein